MVNKILSGAGVIKDKTYRETLCLKPPRETYAVYLDSVNRRGGDTVNLIKEHDYSIELYEYAPDPEAEARIEAQFDAYGIEYTKQSRYWIQSEQLYQVVYDFSFIEK